MPSKEIQTYSVQAPDTTYDTFKETTKKILFPVVMGAVGVPGTLLLAVLTGALKPDDSAWSWAMIILPWTGAVLLWLLPAWIGIGFCLWASAQMKQATLQHKAEINALLPPSAAYVLSVRLERVYSNSAGGVAAVFSLTNHGTAGHVLITDANGHLGPFSHEPEKFMARSKETMPIHLRMGNSKRITVVAEHAAAGWFVDSVARGVARLSLSVAFEDEKDNIAKIDVPTFDFLCDVPLSAKKEVPPDPKA